MYQIRPARHPAASGPPPRRLRPATPPPPARRLRPAASGPPPPARRLRPAASGPLASGPPPARRHARRNGPASGSLPPARRHARRNGPPPARCRRPAATPAEPASGSPPPASLPARRHARRNGACGAMDRHRAWVAFRTMAERAARRAEELRRAHRVPQPPLFRPGRPRDQRRRVRRAGQRAGRVWRGNTRSW